MAKKKSTSGKKGVKKNSKKVKISSRKKSVSKKKVSTPSPNKGKKLNPNKGLGLYIRLKTLLWREYKQDWNGLDYRSKNSNFLSVVHDVYEECKFWGADCTDEVLTNKYQEIIGHLKRPEPQLPLSLTVEPSPYWEIKSVEFELFEPYLWVKSPMIMPSSEGFKVSDYLDSKMNKYEGYQKYFKDLQQASSMSLLTGILFQKKRCYLKS